MATEEASKEKDAPLEYTICSEEKAKAAAQSQVDDLSRERYEAEEKSLAVAKELEAKSRERRQDTWHYLQTNAGTEPVVLGSESAPGRSLREINDSAEVKEDWANRDGHLSTDLLDISASSEEVANKEDETLVSEIVDPNNTSRNPTLKASPGALYPKPNLARFKRQARSKSLSVETGTTIPALLQEQDKATTDDYPDEDAVSRILDNLRISIQNKGVIWARTMFKKINVNQRSGTLFAFPIIETL